MIAQRGFGLHHFGVSLRRFRGDMRSLTRPQASSRSTWPKSPMVPDVAYYDTLGRLPAMIEVIAYLPATRHHVR